MQERRRAEILATVDAAEASFARGEGRRVETREHAVQLAKEIQIRGLQRLNDAEKRQMGFSLTPEAEADLNGI